MNLDIDTTFEKRFYYFLMMHKNKIYNRILTALTFRKLYSFKFYFYINNTLISLILILVQFDDILLRLENS